MILKNWKLWKFSVGYLWLKFPLYFINFSKNFVVFFNCLSALALDRESKYNINTLFENGSEFFSNNFLSSLKVWL